MFFLPVDKENIEHAALVGFFGAKVSDHVTLLQGAIMTFPDRARRLFHGTGSLVRRARAGCFGISLTSLFRYQPQYHSDWPPIPYKTMAYHDNSGTEEDFSTTIDNTS
ncbi:hypothetical protein [Pseudoduganella lurida]|uniref:hypothetical protein n=1 Tax=Pseudoduganella lurida TaxID=1036180 RepID=UPI0018F77DA0|nr:hypothetical protein [Pseudoduganella lurida]